MATEMQPVFNRYFHADDFSTDEAVQAAVKAHAATKLIAWFRGEEQPSWAKHLRPYVRRVFNLSARCRDRHGVRERALLE